MNVHLAILLAFVATQSICAQSPPPEGSFLVEKNVMVPMRDGVRLATDIYFPARNAVRLEGKFPVVMERTPYNKDGAGRSWASYFANRGYVGIAQDTRGRYASDGIWHMITDDVNDGYDMAAWIVAQSWSDGGIGTVGTSYCGGTQHALALSNPPGLKAMVPVDPLANAGYFGMRNGGAWELRFANWIFNIAGPSGSRAARDPATRAALQEAGKNVRQYLLSLPLRRGTTPLRLAEEYESWLVEAMGHGENDAYWKKAGLNVVDNVERYKDVPVYQIGGWYDSWARQTTMSYMALARTKHAPQKLIMGPWIHGQHTRSAHGQVDFGPEAAIDGLAFRLRWFDRWLKGIANGVDADTPVKIFVMGGGSEAKLDDRHLHGGHWRDEREWPLKRTRFTLYYLHFDGTLSKDRPQEPSSRTSYDFNPRDPVPTIGGNISSANEIMLQGAWDQKCGPHVWNCLDNTLPLSARRDVLVFQTSPLTEDVEVTGPIEVKLWISSSALDTDFTAKLIDVHPPTADFPAGIDMNIEDGVLRARFRNSLARAELMSPGTIYPITVQLYPTSNIFKAGHRIRLDVSSSNFPRFDVNPNTAEPLNTHRRMAIATNTIFHDAQRPSHVILPVVPQR